MAKNAIISLLLFYYSNFTNNRFTLDSEVFLQNTDAEKLLVIPLVSKNLFNEMAVLLQPR